MNEDEEIDIDSINVLDMLAEDEENYDMSIFQVKLVAIHDWWKKSKKVVVPDEKDNK